MDIEKDDQTQIGVRISLKTRRLIEKAARRDNRKPADAKEPGKPKQT